MERYPRQIRLAEVGEQGQRKLARARVLIVGIGGLGTPAALYLAGAGVGHLGLVDCDRVALSNLHRQVLFGVEDVGRKKVSAASDRLLERNPEIAIEARDERLGVENAREMVRGYHVVIDGTDAIIARYALNDACVREGVPFVHGSVHQHEGRCSVFATPEGPCYRCLYRDPPRGELQSCEAGGVLGPVPGLVGVAQANETLKLLLGIGAPLSGRLLLIDALDMRFRTVPIARDPLCPACGPRKRIFRI